MNAIRTLSRTRARNIGSAAILAMALLVHGCIDGGEAPPEAAEVTLAQVVRPGPGGPGGGGGGAATPLACQMLNLPANTPPPPSTCVPLQCGAHCGAWEGICLTVEQAAGLIVPFSEFLSAIILFGEVSPDLVCNVAWERAGRECATDPQSDACISRRIVATCGCLMHETTRGYGDSARLACEDCACWRRSGPYPYGSSTKHFDEALRCYRPRTSPRPGRGGGFGDPHLQTLDGGWIEHQFAGEFVALRKRADQTGPDLDVRFREEPTGGSFGGDVSSVTAVAVRYGSVVVSVYMNPFTEVRVNGTEVSLEDGYHDTGGAGDYAEIFREGDVYKIVLPNGDQVSVDDGSGLWLNIGLELTTELQGKTEGLLGNWNSVADEPSLGVNAFRVMSASSSLLLRDSDDWAALDDTTFPANPFNPNAAPPEVVAAAQQACMAAGVTDQAILAGCIHDVAATGDETAAEAAADAGDLLAPVADAPAPVIPME